ncbi:MAG: hypothetical protein IT165_14335 [Bryobacterales bacterium]|nr:hypothetical protein [Bryobacterales bacterium]
MTTIAAAATSALRDLLAGENGITLAPDIAALARGTLVVPVLTGNVPLDLAERAPISYPSIQVYCDKVSNSQREKFRTFSGYAHLVVEIRSSAEQISATEQLLQSYADSVLRVLNENKGDWGGGRFYGGGYEVTFTPMKRGGLNYLQVARIAMSLDITLD